MKKSNVIDLIFPQGVPCVPLAEKVTTFAPTNIALCKYWGKRNEDINLPMTPSLSVALPEKGATTHIHLEEGESHRVYVNAKEMPADSAFTRRLFAYLDLFLPPAQRTFVLHINILVNIPIAAGLASSAAGFASLILALNELFSWQLSLTSLSILARLGSGSAARSLWDGFVEWERGERADGMDSYGVPLAFTFPSLCVGVLPISDAVKPISSREAMACTVRTSQLYAGWEAQVDHDLPALKKAIVERDFVRLGEIAEHNALSMHATMLSSRPPICYALPQTTAAMHMVWQLRKESMPLYFTQDAGPNLKLLFLSEHMPKVIANFPEVEIVSVF